MKNINEVLNFTIKFLHHVKFQHNQNTTLRSTLWLKLIFKCTKWWCMMGIVVHSHSTAGTCSPWWHPGNPGTPSPWRPCRGWWWGWRRRATGRRATGWRSCPETPTTTRQHPTVHTRPAETHTGNSNTSCWFVDYCFADFTNVNIWSCVNFVCVGHYPEEQVEEEEHVLDAADATTSHDFWRALQEMNKKKKVIKGVD